MTTTDQCALLRSLNNLAVRAYRGELDGGLPERDRQQLVLLLEAFNDAIATRDATIAELRAEADACEAIRDRLSNLLDQTAIALRGQEPPLTKWSFHDIPDRAAAAIAAIDVMVRAAAELSTQLAALTAEAKRWRWIEENATSQGGGNGFTLSVFVPHDIEDWGAAIDAARATKGDAA